MSSNGYHEPLKLLTEDTLDLHRAIVSLVEELEAIDWYQQRAQACKDPGLKAILVHNRDEEVEHAAMMLEWLRRHRPEFDVQLRKYLFSEGPITDIEDPQDESVECDPERRSTSLGIGHLGSGSPEQTE